jgi:hypothetical protein
MQPLGGYPLSRSAKFRLGDNSKMFSQSQLWCAVYGIMKINLQLQLNSNSVMTLNAQLLLNFYSIRNGAPAELSKNAEFFFNCKLNKFSTANCFSSTKDSVKVGVNSGARSVAKFSITSFLFCILTFLCSFCPKHVSSSWPTEYIAKMYHSNMHLSIL